MDHKTKATIAGCVFIVGAVGLLTTAMTAFSKNPGHSMMILVFGSCLFYGTSLTTALKYEAAKEEGDSPATGSKDEA